MVHMLVLFLFFDAPLSSITAAPLCIPIKVSKGSNFSTCLPTLVFYFFDNSWQVEDDISLWFWFVGPWWLVTFEHCFIYILTICMSSLEKCLFKFLAQFSIWLSGVLCHWVVGLSHTLFYPISVFVFIFFNFNQFLILTLGSQCKSIYNPFTQTRTSHGPWIIIGLMSWRDKYKCVTHPRLFETLLLTQESQWSLVPKAEYHRG